MSVSTTLGMLALAAGMVQPAPATVPLQPSGKWNVEYSDSMCVLSHDYGEGDARVTLAFRPLPLGANTEIALITTERNAAATQGVGSLLLGGTATVADGSYTSWSVPNTTRRVTTLRVGEDATAALAQATTITLKLQKRAPVTVAPKSAKPALAALKTCQDDLIRGWGVDPTETDRIATPAKGSAVGWLTSDDYPYEAMNVGAQGDVTILWTIDTRGYVPECRVLVSSGNASLDAAACRVLKQRAHYAPALGRDGNRW